MPRFPSTLARLLPLFLALEGHALTVSVFQGIDEHVEPSTGTFGKTMVNLPGSDLKEDTLSYSVEASIAPSFTLLKGSLGPVPGSAMLNVTPKFLVRRMDGVASNPVRTPSYMPYATLFYSPVDSLTVITRHRHGKYAPDLPDYWYLSLGGSHYSNGETGVFLRPDGSLNNIDGSFSLYSLWAGAHFYNDWPLLPAYKSFQVEHVYNKEGLLEALYPDWIISLKMQTADYDFKGWWGLAARSRVLIDLDWRVRNGSRQPDALKPEPFSAAVAGVYLPQWGPFRNGPFGIFGRFYGGFDYYNMNFDKEIYRVDFGIIFLPRGGLAATEL